MAGGWSPYREPTQEDIKIFKENLAGLVGVKYVPDGVSSQIVDGTNYRFICNAKPIAAEPYEYKATIQIYAPLQGEPYITHITPH